MSYFIGFYVSFCRFHPLVNLCPCISDSLEIQFGFFYLLIGGDIVAISERYYKTIPYEKHQKGPLTEKQYLVYAYLLSISKWNPNEAHYFVYKNSFKIKDAIEIIGISDNTWRRAIAALIKNSYISENEKTKSYQIYYGIDYAALDINLIKLLIKYSKQFDKECGGIMPSLYSVLARYYAICNGEDVEFTLSSLCTLFFKERTKSHMRGIYIMLSLFQSLDLLGLKEIPHELNNGRSYYAYQIKWIDNKPSKKMLQMEDSYENDKVIQEFLEGIKQNIEIKEDFYGDGSGIKLNTEK